MIDKARNQLDDESIPSSVDSNYEDEINLREFFRIIWRGKFIIIGFMLVFALAGFLLATSLNDQYETSVIVVPSSGGDDAKYNNLSGQLGGLANIVGLDIGGDSSIPNSIIALELMKSWGFIDEFIDKHSIAAPLYAVTEWDRENNKLIYDDQLFDGETEEWVYQRRDGTVGKPVSWDLYERFSENLMVSENKDNGLITIRFQHVSPHISHFVANQLVLDVNDYMRQQALANATKSIEYLENEIGKTSLSDMRSVFYALIQEQIKNKMLANVKDDYVFSGIGRSLMPAEPVYPNRLIVILGATFFGLLAGLLLLAMRNIFK